MPHPAPIPSRRALAMPDPDNRRWPLERQVAFLRQLSATHSVAEAARSVGMSRQSAYRLRGRLKGGVFDLVGEVAFHHSYDVLAHVALERALSGGKCRCSSGRAGRLLPPLRRAAHGRAAAVEHGGRRSPRWGRRGARRAGKAPPYGITLVHGRGNYRGVARCRGRSRKVTRCNLCHPAAVLGKGV